MDELFWPQFIKYQLFEPKKKIQKKNFFFLKVFFVWIFCRFFGVNFFGTNIFIDKYELFWSQVSYGNNDEK